MTTTNPNRTNPYASPNGTPRPLPRDQRPPNRRGWKFVIVAFAIQIVIVVAMMLRTSFVFELDTYWMLNCMSVSIVRSILFSPLVIVHGFFPNLFTKVLAVATLAFSACLGMAYVAIPM